MPTIAGIYYTENNTPETARPPIILIHGCGSDHTCWPAELRRLPGHRVLTLDLPGHGRSAGFAQHSIERCSKTLIDFMDALNLYRAVLVGHSMGGGIALYTAINYPQRVQALGLIASAAYLGIPADILDNLSHLNTTPLALKALQRRLFSPCTPPSVIKKTSELLASIRPGILFADYQAAAQYDLRGCISQMQTPVWIATGTRDALIPLSYVRFLSTSLPNARICMVENAGHLVMLEAPKTIAEKFGEFLRNLDGVTESGNIYPL